MCSNDAVMAFLDVPHSNLTYLAHSLCRPLFGRVQRDPELQRLLRTRLSNPQHPSQAVSVARILYLAMGLDPDLRDWSDSKAGSSNSDVFPWRLGTDLTTGTVKGEWEGGMDILFGMTRS